MYIFYNIALRLYYFAILVFSLFDNKAHRWVAGRRGFFSKWSHTEKGDKKLLWIHCASLGEFEQGRPVIEEIRRRKGDKLFILLSFFSPSGYEIRKNYSLVDAVCYLPLDTKRNAALFIDLFNPDVAIFVKYEFWYNYIQELKSRKIPLFVISSNFRSDQVFFRWYGGWFRKILKNITHLFVQDIYSLRLLNSIGIIPVTVSGDTRFDRVAALVNERRDLPVIGRFTRGHITIIAGSTWPADHNLLVRFMNETGYPVRMIIAPHEMDEKEIESVIKQYNGNVQRYSGADELNVIESGILIIDNVGLLSLLYRYGTFAYIGGGFGKGIHNILEACTYDKPVIIGPNYSSFREANELIKQGGVFPVKSYEEFAVAVNRLISNKDFLNNAGTIAGSYVQSGRGASKLIADSIESRLSY